MHQNSFLQYHINYNIPLLHFLRLCMYLHKEIYLNYLYLSNFHLDSDISISQSLIDKFLSLHQLVLLLVQVL